MNRLDKAVVGTGVNRKGGSVKDSFSLYTNIALRAKFLITLTRQFINHSFYFVYKYYRPA